MKEFVLTKILYNETRYRIVYVPVYIAKYTAGLEEMNGEKETGKDKKGKLQKYTFMLNAQTGKHDGLRPYGMGKVLGYGMRLLEGFFGVKDQENVAFISGKHLRATDACAFYEEDAQYLLFPPSHSYLLTYDIGYITVKNGGKKDLLLFGHKREAEEPSGRFVLKAGAQETFDFKGSWCIRVEEDKPSSAFSPEAVLSVVQISPDGGGSYGNLLSMI